MLPQSFDPVKRLDRRGCSTIITRNKKQIKRFSSLVGRHCLASRPSPYAWLTCRPGRCSPGSQAGETLPAIQISHLTTICLETLFSISKITNYRTESWPRKNKFVKSDAQWLLSFYKIVTQSITQSISLVFQGSVCCEAATDQKESPTKFFICNVL